MRKLYKRFLCCFLIVVMTVTYLPMARLDVYAQDTVPEGYTPIYTIEDLYNINANMSGNYILMNDIDMSATKGGAWDSGYGWAPIGNPSGNERVSFSGTFDGNGHRLKNLYISSKPSYGELEYIGLFYCNYGTIKSLALDSVSITAMGARRVGGICGNNDKYIKDCYVTGSISGANNDMYICVGGITGYVNAGTIDSCYTDVAVSGKNCGGICGRMDGCNTYSCYAVGTADGGGMICGVYYNYNNYENLNNYFLQERGVDTHASNLTSMMMKQQGSFYGFDFDEHWYIDSNATYPYPQLKKCPQCRATSIKISSLPDKTVYFTTDGKVDVTGGTIDITYEDGKVATGVPVKDSMLSYDFLPGEQVVTLEYAGKTTTFSITVNKATPTITAKDTYTYYVNDSFDLGVTCDSPGAMAFEYDIDSGIILLRNNKVTCLKVGTITVTVVVAETAIYNSARKDITINVLESNGDDTDDDSGYGNDVVMDGDTFTRAGIHYDIKIQDDGYRYARVLYMEDDYTKTVVIPDQVAFKGDAFDVAVICDDAFSGQKKIKSISLGANIEAIGLRAFKNCKKLKKISINSSKLESVGKNALKSIHKNCKIYVPKAKKKAYKKLFKKKGQKSTVKFVNL